MAEELESDLETDAEEDNAYEKEREERIKRNKAKLEELQVARMAKELAAPLIAAANAKKQLRDERRAAVEAVTPRRRSMRSSAQQTRQRLSQQAQRAGADSDEEGSGRLSPSDEDAADTDEGHLSKRQRSGEEEEDYDPVADMSEQEGGSVDEASEDEAGVEHEKEVEAVDKRPRKSQASATPAGGLSMGSTGRASLPIGDSSDEDAELQQALAMSLMEAHLGFGKLNQGETSAAAPLSERSSSGADAQKEPVPTASMPHGAREEDGAAVHGAAKNANAKSKGNMRAGDEGAQQKVPNGKGTGDKKGGGRKRAAVPLVASPQDVRNAFAVLAGSKRVITAQSLKTAWDEMRGGELPDGCMEDMLTYAAEVTGSNELTASGFEQLVCALSH